MFPITSLLERVTFLQTNFESATVPTASLGWSTVHDLIQHLGGTHQTYGDQAGNAVTVPTSELPTNPKNLVANLSLELKKYNGEKPPLVAALAMFLIQGKDIS